MKTIAAATLLAAILVACAGSAGTTGPGLTGPAGPAGVAGRTFLSTLVTRDGEPVQLVPNTQVRLAFQADGNLGASAGCNSIGGSYRVDGGTLRFEGGGMTEMGCDAPRHQQDEWLVGFLAADPTVELRGNELVLSAGSWVVTLTDREVLEPDLPLVGPLWTVTSIVTGDAVASIPDGTRATLRFGADGRVQLHTGCNEGGATYSVDGSTLSFRDVVTTDVACDGATMQLEAAVLAVLGAGSVEGGIDASTLTLQAGPNGLMLTGG